MGPRPMITYPMPKQIVDSGIPMPLGRLRLHLPLYGTKPVPVGMSYVGIAVAVLRCAFAFLPLFSPQFPMPMPVFFGHAHSLLSRLEPIIYSQ